MSAKLYMDVHVPTAVTFALRRRGFDVLTCQDDGTGEFDDVEVLERSTLLNRVLFTQDTDFLNIGSAWQSAGNEFREVVFAHQLGPSIGQIIEDLELLLSVATEEELSNRVIHLPLRS